MALRQRLLQDIAELKAKPYPNISLIPQDGNIQQACLILTPNGGAALHFPSNYPLQPPNATIQSRILHPNVYGDFICASILNKTESYTPAYTLKGIAIQLLSFFSSDKLEQDFGGTIDITKYREAIGGDPNSLYNLFDPSHTISHVCRSCSFNSPQPNTENAILAESSTGNIIAEDVRSRSSTSNQHSTETVNSDVQPHIPFLFKSRTGKKTVQPRGRKIPKSLASLPDEMLVLVCNELETEELMVFARSWSRIGGENGIMTKFSLIRNRELICFCLKQSFEKTKLGVGVHVANRGRQGTLSSEFDLLSRQAFEDFNVRRSVQGLPFEYWLPLPLSRRHYASVVDHVRPCIIEIAQEAHLTSTSPVDIICHFMSDVVVKLSTQASGSSDRSSLSHASEKAIDSYYHLFHLLLCVATEDDSAVRSINRVLQGVLNGRRSKKEVPNLGHLLVAVLISDADMTQDLLMAIIKETITRNVVWMLDQKGQGMAELSYMEADAVSQYRLRKTFAASKTSYRLLMFLNLFRQTINRGTGQAKKSLGQLRDELFDAHGAPPRGTAAKLAKDIKTLQEVDSFPQFLKIMGLQPPSASQFTTVLRESVQASVRNGYSVWGISQERALTLRKQLDPNVQVRQTTNPEWISKGTFQGGFFPNHGGGRGGRGGRGRGR